ncbi:MAG: hypothetical protein TREMPRED_006021 [Tremellales sp. Tagirdzhanova-0007]|nr:MAG: hypothetical protein TREMPRED_006021 [Tremellales sp. Tagirdzhanova-0007]
MSDIVTKKKQKALAFRAKQKAKRSGHIDEDQQEVPEQDVPEDEMHDASLVAEGSQSKRRRIAVDSERSAAVDDSVGPKNKRKAAWEDVEENEGVKERKNKKEIKQRFILFVGNLGYETTREDVQAHFQPAIGHAPAVRLLTNKSTPSPATSGKAKRKPVAAKSRGIAFLELPTSLELQACLKLHHSSLKERIINVELTAGGGGKGEGRREKIRERNVRVGQQRERKAEREKEPGTEVDHGVEIVQEGEKKKIRTETAMEGMKIRGGRRVKIMPKPNGRGEGRSAPTISSTGRSSWPNGTPRQSGPGMQQGRRKWEPTGANAVAVS